MRYGRWEVIEELGRGGQGIAYRVIDSSKVDVEKLVAEVHAAFGKMRVNTSDEQQRSYSLELLSLLERYLGRHGPENTAALKVLRPDLPDAQKARQRLKEEVNVVSKLNHPSLLKVLDSQIDEGWLVMPLYTEGTLATQQGRFAGKPTEALQSFRSLLEGVAELHKRSIVHRDIKPENIFVVEDKLVLGDFGIAYVDDAGHTRVSDTYENVGSRDWMPPWAMGRRVEVRPSFDVCSLGKVLWAMVSGRTKLPLWYWEEAEFNLLRLFPLDERMAWINNLLRGSVRQKEEDTWPTATQFLERVDGTLSILRRGGQVFKGMYRACRVCGVGVYELLVGDDNHTARRNLRLDTGQKIRVFQCGYCGHLDLFRMTENPLAWPRPE